MPRMSDAIAERHPAARPQLFPTLPRAGRASDDAIPPGRALTRAAQRLQNLFLRTHVKSRYPDDSLAPAPPRHSPAGLGRSVDPVGFASGVGEGSVGFDRVVFDRVDSEQFAVL